MFYFCDLKFDRLISYLKKHIKRFLNSFVLFVQNEKYLL